MTLSSAPACLSVLPRRRLLFDVSSLALVQKQYDCLFGEKSMRDMVWFLRTFILTRSLFLDKLRNEFTE